MLPCLKLLVKPDGCVEANADTNADYDVDEGHVLFTLPGLTFPLCLHTSNNNESKLL